MAQREGTGKAFFLEQTNLPAEGKEIGRKGQRFLLPRKKDGLHARAAGHFNSIKHMVPRSTDL